MSYVDGPLEPDEARAITAIADDLMRKHPALTLLQALALATYEYENRDI